METATSTNPEAAHRIARKAYAYGLPMVENDKTLDQQAIDTSDPRINQVISVIWGVRFSKKLLA